MRRFPIILLPLLAAACGEAESSDEEKTPAPVALVKLARVETGAIAERATLYGVAEAGPGGKAALTAPAEAQVVRIATPVGAAVSAGSVVAVLSAAPSTRLDLAKAAADARGADLAFARAQRLRADGLGSNAEVDAARAAAAGADATLASLRARAGGLTLRAPIAGFVDSIAVTQGDLVQPGAAIASVSRTGSLRARFGAEADTARRLGPGRSIQVQAAGGATFSAAIDAVSPIADPQTRLVSVYARVPTGSHVAIGEALTGAVPVGRAQGDLVLPYAALLDDGGQPYVYVVSGGAAHRRDVMVGASGGDRAAIVQGVSAGEQVVIEGGTALEDGMRVRTR